MIQKLLNIDRRWIFLFIFVGVAAAMLSPLPLPIRPSSDVKNVYNTIESIKGKPNATVLLSFDYGPGSEPELQPTAISIIRQCFRNNIKVVGMALWPDAVGLAQAAFDSVSRAEGKEYGKDWTFLGYKTGSVTLILNMGEDFHGAFNVDYRGNKTSEMPVTQHIAKLGSFDYVVTLAAGKTIDGVWVTYAVDRYRIKLGGATTAVTSPDMFPYLQSGQLNGLVSGLAGAAEYETLVRTQGSATRGMQPQSAAHLIIIISIIIGNTMYFVQRRRDRRQSVSGNEETRS
ncbi:MAG: hypothetical protein BWY06_01500 [Candidatus Latescibacteria bacterium ADurb.Bin168]|nr:MAG: hypothetical protein BWY06_01500 [Candidatus Latescibacteria bacterium ADurb.Bin168]